MKNTFIKTLLFFIGFTMPICTFAQKSTTEIHLEANWDDPTVLGSQFPRVPARIPIIYQCGHTLSFNAFSTGCTLECHTKEKPSYTHTLKLVIQLLTFRYHCLVIMFYTLNLIL